MLFILSKSLKNVGPFAVRIFVLVSKFWWADPCIPACRQRQVCVIRGLPFCISFPA